MRVQEAGNLCSINACIVRMSTPEAIAMAAKVIWNCSII